MRARWYDPTTGQFLTRDPIESVTRRPYGYANNAPLTYTDPTGLAARDPFQRPMIPPPESPEFAEWNRQREEETRQMRAEADCRARAESWAKFQQKVQLGLELNAWKAHVAEAERNQPRLFEDMRSHVVIDPRRIYETAVLAGVGCYGGGKAGATIGIVAGAPFMLEGPLGAVGTGIGCVGGAGYGILGPPYPDLY